jgi:hypothetical protein
MNTFVSPPALKEKDWLRVECRARNCACHGGIYMAGGVVYGQYTQDVFYKHRYGVDVITLRDPVLNDWPIVILLEDVVSVAVLAKAPHA